MARLKVRRRRVTKDGKIRYTYEDGTVVEVIDEGVSVSVEKLDESHQGGE
jgi:hypothetical protein